MGDGQFLPRVQVKLGEKTYGGPVERFVLSLVREKGMTTDSIWALCPPPMARSAVQQALYRLAGKDLVVRTRARRHGVLVIVWSLA